jgi:hypothetical protein
MDAGDALHEEPIEVAGVVGHDDIAGARRVGAVGAAVDDGPVAGAEGRAHALALDGDALEAAAEVPGGDSDEEDTCEEAHTAIPVSG